MHSHGGHAPADSDRPASEAKLRPLLVAFVITVVFLIVEAVGGWITGSLALLADAGHMLTDVGALGLSLLAIRLARRPATPEYSFGFHRAEVLAAAVNAAALIAISLVIYWEAARRLLSPPSVDSGPMLIVAIAGLIANAASAWVLSRGGGHRHNLNTRGAFLHVLSDLLGSLAAVVAALIMLATGWYLADPILSALIGLLILWSAWRLLRETVDVLLEATPEGIDAPAVATSLCKVAGVQDVHDLHIWTVTSGLIAMSAHIELTGARPWADVLPDLGDILRSFGIAHITLQPERQDEATTDPYRGCTLDTPEGRAACAALALRQKHAPGPRG